ncbi:COPII subunit SFB2 [Nakaseomyces bracarensis]|uniref:COPII subunit SFB2 n=1 Tax=Nakaseomyces bracarensis TaxID=273131 RepID=UPI0038726380
MSHHKKRVYPEAQFQYSQGQANALPQDAMFPGQVGTPMMGASDNVMPGYGQTPMSPMVQGGAEAQMFTPAQQQLNDQLQSVTTGMGDMNIGAPMQGQPMPAQQQMYGQQQIYSRPMQPQQPQMYGQSPGAVSHSNRPVNQLYPVDLLTELPPPIQDLSLPPPPLMVAPEKMIVPSETSNASSDYLRCTLNAMPKSSSLLKKSKLPLALVIRPYQHLQDEINPPPLNEDGLVVRCRRCRAYLNPFASFIEQGRKWRCNFCRLANDVPMQLDQTYEGSPANRYDRNEIRHAVMEYLAPKEYTVRQPPPSTYVFVLDVSQNAVKNGLLATTARSILDTLEFLPNHDGRTRVAILCVDNALHYFSVPLDEESDQIKMMDVCDLDEPFMPKPHSMVVSLSSCRNNLEKLLNQLPEIFQFNIMSKFALGPALKAAQNMISNIGGKIIVVSATLPNTGVGKLQRRNESGVANTAKESSQLLSCQDSFYKNFTITCSKSQVSVDMFLASEDYMDVATLSNLGRFTGGQTHFYPGFTAANIADVTKFTKEFSKFLSMDLSTETVMRARGSTGIRMNSFYGHFFNRSSDLCAFSTMPRDQSYVFEMSIDENIVVDYCYIQIAVLLSLNTSQRRIRIITLAIPTTESLSEVYASADQLAMTTFYARKAVEKAMNTSLQDARDLLSKAVQDILATYKKEIVVSNTAGGAPLRFSANLRMFPLLMHALSKHTAFRSGVVPSDHRAAALNNLESAPLQYFIKSAYAKVYSLHDMVDEAGYPNEDGEIVLPQPINSSASLFERYGLYLIDNASELFLWVGGDAVPELVNDVFGIQDIFQIANGKQELPIVEGSDFNERVRNIIQKVREHDDIITYQTLYIVRGPSVSEPVGHAAGRELQPLRMWATSNLVEDKVLGTESYREFLQTLKNKISK